MLKGEKVILRPVKRSDLDYFIVWANDPEVMRYMGGYLPMTEMAGENDIEDIPKQSNTEVAFIIEAVAEETCRSIGSIVLSKINHKDHCATFAITIGEKDYWNKGYGTEATRLIIRYGFEQLNLHRISSFVFSFNERSIRMHLRAGFIEEGRRKESIYINGTCHDSVMFGLLKKEWQAMVNTNK
ncbi:MAG: GNAT family N-acetyltransferase [Dehalococcoidales bacterium]|nr:MAG: GNAT family N-acetyltransferase [Dehalococcoidales bacterium]